jgi:hypothetical protein
MSSLQFLRFVNKQLPNETADAIISQALMNLNGLIYYYIPVNQILDNQKLMFNTLLALLGKETTTA